MSLSQALASGEPKLISAQYMLAIALFEQVVIDSRVEAASAETLHFLVDGGVCSCI